MNDITRAKEMVSGRDGGAVVGDRAYDSDAFIAHVEALGMGVVIPSRVNRRYPRELDKETYRLRNVIERLFGRLKMFRRVATRYDKTERSYLGFVRVAAWMIIVSGWSP